VKTIIFGAGGFIGSHLARRISESGHRVTGVDLKLPEFSDSSCDHFLRGDLRNFQFVSEVVTSHALSLGSGEELRIYQLAADMGGAGYVFSGENDAEIMLNSSSINANLVSVCRDLIRDGTVSATQLRIFYSSSACIYPEDLQRSQDSVSLREEFAYPANPDSEYGWEKLFSERLYLAFGRNYGATVRIGRYHNIFGPEGTWRGGKEKAPAAICRKIAELPDQGGNIEVWGDGNQTRSFLYIRDCIDATLLLMDSNHAESLNIGSEEMVSIAELVRIVQKISGKVVGMDFQLDRPVGVAARNSNNDQMRIQLNWEPQTSLTEGLGEVYAWVQQELLKSFVPSPTIPSKSVVSGGKP